MNPSRFVGLRIQREHRKQWRSNANEKQSTNDWNGSKSRWFHWHDAWRVSILSNWFHYLIVCCGQSLNELNRFSLRPIQFLSTDRYQEEGKESRVAVMTTGWLTRYGDTSFLCWSEKYRRGDAGSLRAFSIPDLDENIVVGGIVFRYSWMLNALYREREEGIAMIHRDKHIVCSMNELELTTSAVIVIIIQRLKYRKQNNSEASDKSPAFSFRSNVLCISNTVQEVHRVQCSAPLCAQVNIFKIIDSKSDLKISVQPTIFNFCVRSFLLFMLLSLLLLLLLL